MKKLLIITAMALAGCASHPQDSPAGDENLIAADMDQTPQDKRPVVVGWQDSHTGDDLAVIVDSETHCQYIVYGTQSSGAAITPRLKPNGGPMCGEAKKQ